jgi:hypothetical protein
MKFAGLLLSFLLFVAGMAFAQNNKYDAGQTIEHNQTIEGCLTHNTGSYQLVNSNGTRHMLMGDSQALSSHVGQEVKLTGAADYNRDASASGNNGMMNGQRFFRVDNVTEISGSCHK